MANSIWQGTVQNAAGDIVPGAEITVVDEVTGLPATIFSSIGGAALGNPFFANSEGFAQFYAAAGTYRVTAEDTGTGQTVVFRYNRFGDAASRDVGTAAGQIMEVGSFGLGLIVQPDSTGSLNMFKTSGQYHAVNFTDGPVGAPATNAYLTVESAGNANYTSQTLTTLVGKKYIRTQSNAIWLGWQQIFDTGNFNHLQNTSGGSIASNVATAGSNLTPSQSGTWLNASGASIANNGYGLWIKQ